MDAFCLAMPITVASRLDRLEKVARELRVRFDAVAKAERERAQAEGALSSLRDGILAILLARGIPVSDAERARVGACSDVATAQRWLVRAATARSADEALAG
jgi:hypothetical protein